jgi:hypothetical protein
MHSSPSRTALFPLLPLSSAPSPASRPGLASCSLVRRLLCDCSRPRSSGPRRSILWTLFLWTRAWRLHVDWFQEAICLTGELRWSRTTRSRRIRIASLPPFPASTSPDDNSHRLPLSTSSNPLLVTSFLPTEDFLCFRPRRHQSFEPRPRHEAKTVSRIPSKTTAVPLSIGSATE